ncbi:unnamed protein product [Moneuplotes crassus]|uniref:Zinc finger LSD1-type domain-containing protein n=1 Tax=Euplotes crassus TaxID=5936 RepID=A0AAD1Y974_EUPCR|nr:unnamed protein product [Moneuplotes crassus]
MSSAEEHIIVQMPDNSILIATKLPPPPKARLRCWSCQTTLEYTIGSAQVQCAICSQMNGVSSTPHSAGTAYVKCDGCSTTLKYTKGFERIKCGVCNNIIAVDQS